MASLTIRNLDASIKETLRLNAARHGRSMEEEVRHILRESLLREKSSQGLGSRIAQRFAAVGGVELPAATRSLPRRPLAFEADASE